MSGSAIPPLNVQITATDKSGPVLDRANKRLAQAGQAAEKTGKGLAKLGETSGITRLSEGMATLSGTSANVFRSVSQLAPALSGITGAASLAGMTALVARWSQLGQQAYLTGQRLGVPTDRLTALRGAARLAGASAEDLDSGLHSLDERLRGATFRGDAQAIQTFGQLGVSFRKDATHARGAADALGDVADGMKRLYDGGRGRGAALRVAQNLGLEGLFPLLIQGRAGIQALQARAAQLGGVISPDAAKRADELKSSFSGLGLALEGVENRLGDQFGQAIKPYIDGTATWIGNNKEVADTIGGIGASILALGAIRPAAWLARLLGISALVTPSILASPLLLSGDTDAKATSDGFRKGWKPNMDPGPGGDWIDHGVSWYRSVAPTWLGGSPVHVSPANIGVPRRGTAAFDVMKRTHDFWMSKGFNEKQVAGILAGGPAAESGFNPDQHEIGGTAYGLYQWDGSRRDALIAKYGAHPTVDQQNQFAWDELHEPGQHNTLAALRATQDSGPVASVWTKGFERPKDGSYRAMERAAAAPKFEGAADIQVTISGAPPGTRATATSSGNVNVAPPRVETAMPLH